MMIKKKISTITTIEMIKDGVERELEIKSFEFVVEQLLLQKALRMNYSGM